MTAEPPSHVGTPDADGPGLVADLFPGSFAMVMATMVVVAILYSREFRSEVLHILRD